MGMPIAIASNRAGKRVAGIIYGAGKIGAIDQRERQVGTLQLRGATKLVLAQICPSQIRTRQIRRHDVDAAYAIHFP